MKSILFTVTVLTSSFLDSSLGFSAKTLHKRLLTNDAASKSSSSSLGVAASILSEEEAIYRMEKARECAFSDSCSVEESREHLHDVLYIQSGCAGGLLAGKELCENQDLAAEIVAHLREKADETKMSSVAMSNKTVANSVASTAVLALVFVLMSSMNHGQEAAPFTLQEWWWAAKGGYLDDMVSHYIRLGGL